MKTIDIMKAIRNVFYKRRARGSSNEDLKRYLNHLQTETWKNSPEIIEEIQQFKEFNYF